VEEKGRLSWASHGVGRLLGEQSPATHHFQGRQAIKRHEEAQGCRGLVGLGKEAFQAWVGLLPAQSNQRILHETFGQALLN
jgi:hypothetical protein